MTCSLPAGNLGLGDTRRNSCIELDLAVDRDFRIFLFCLLRGIVHLGDIRILCGAVGGEGKESDLGVYTEDLRALNGLAADLNQLILGGVNVNCAVSHCHDFIFTGRGRTDQDEARGYNAVAGFGLDDLQSRTDRIGCGIGCAAEQAVRNTHLDQHSAEIVTLLKDRKSLLGSHALALSEFAEAVNHLVHFIIILRINDLCPTDIVACFFSCMLHFVGLAQKNRSQEAACKKTGSSLKNTGIRALCKDDCLGILFELLDHCTKTIHNETSLT